MKHLILFLAAIALLYARPMYAAAPAPEIEAATKHAPPEQLFHAKELQLDGIGQMRTRDLRHNAYGGGVALNYFPWRAAGFGLEGRTEDARHAFFDRIGLCLIGRMPIDKIRVAPEFRLGFDYDPERIEADRERGRFDLFASVGGELRLPHGFGIGAEIRGVRPVENNPREHILGLLRVRKTF